MNDSRFTKFIDNLPEELKENAKKEVLREDNLSNLSKAIALFAFRSGPIEDMHVNNQLSDEDMEVLNRFMVNRLAYVIDLIINEKWLELEYFVNEHAKIVSHWDAAKIDDGRVKELFSEYIHDAYKKFFS